MKSFEEFLQEIKTEIKPISWSNSDTSKRGEFWVNNIKYVIEIDKTYDIDLWTFKFKKKDDKGTSYINMTNDNNKVGSVITTVNFALAEFVKEYSPTYVMFFGKTSEKGRIRTYDKRAKISGYNRAEFYENGRKFYILYPVGYMISKEDAEIFEQEMSSNYFI